MPRREKQSACVCQGISSFIKKMEREQGGLCRVGEEIRCVLDGHLTLTVAAIEEVQGVILKQGRVLEQS